MGPVAASHPLRNRSLATPNHPADEKVVREEAAGIAAPQVPGYTAVDVTAEDWSYRDRRGGVGTCGRPERARHGSVRLGGSHPGCLPASTVQVKAAGSSMSSTE